ncbi:MAG: glycosyltransferase family 4 protein, partial [bacterium]|nr:glycosyltransferase family 4 protein [bacterium]
ACGKAVIATRVGGLEEVIKDQETGVLVPPDDVTSLTTAILDLLHHPQKRFHLGEKARHEVVTRFSWPHIAELTLTFYKRVIG